MILKRPEKVSARNRKAPPALVKLAAKRRRIALFASVVQGYKVVNAMVRPTPLSRFELTRMRRRRIYEGGGRLDAEK
jgi:hypothetical protein